MIEKINGFVVVIIIISFVVSWLLLYYVVKAAVKNGIKEARFDYTSKVTSANNFPNMALTTEQEQLQKRYDRGEITFEFYQAEWNRLKS